MGNSASSSGKVGISLTGVRRDQGNHPLYKLADFAGKGELLDWMRYSIKSNDYSILDGLIEVKVGSFLYNKGRGKLVPISELMKARNKERNSTLGALRKKKGKGKSGPDILQDVNQEEMQGDIGKALKFLDGGGGKGKGNSRYRELCWDLKQRGIMGETIVNLCLLHGSYIHNEIARRLMTFFPKLINDICLSEDYYGQAPLHQAIVNEDPAMVRFLLMRNADVHQRCVGAFFTPEDQRLSRTDSLEHEWVELSHKTNYNGRTYWGEYPLSFAACLKQTDCFRLLRAARADPNMQDTNGNTVLHMTVIHELPDMFDLAYALGAKLHVVNKQDLTPLTLAAKLAKKTGEQEHLDMLDGLMENILEEKWKAYARRTVLNNFVAFCVHFVLCFLAFYLRPVAPSYVYHDRAPRSQEATNDTATNLLADFARHEQCFLLHHKTGTDQARLGLEGTIIVTTFLYILSTLRGIKRTRWAQFVQSMNSFPARMSFIVSLLFIVLCIPMRFACARFHSAYYWENMLCIFTMVTTTFHFLFFCRAVKFVGPFVLMVYKMLKGDILRFLIIYSILVVGFSQAFVIIFVGCTREMTTQMEKEQVFSMVQNPFEAFMRMFIISVGEFTVFYRKLQLCENLGWLGKIMFVIYELLVTILLINMLIAAMTRTYQQIQETQKEWKRQWAQVILMLEQNSSPKSRLLSLLKYSRPIGTNRAQRSFVVTRELTEAEQSDRNRQPPKVEVSDSPVHVVNKPGTTDDMAAKDVEDEN